VQGKIFVDFSERREGPGGSDILRMLHGLAGKPLPEKAVRLAAEVDEEVKRARSAIQAARLDGDVDRLLELSRSEHLAWSNSPMLRCAVADALIALKRNDEALELCKKLCEGFPTTLRPRQLYGLTFARKGDWRTAQATLGELYAAGEIDPETLGTYVYARTWMDRYNATRDRRYLLKSRDLYRQAFETASKDFYTGINAATKSLLLTNSRPRSNLHALNNWSGPKLSTVNTGRRPPLPKYNYSRVISPRPANCIKRLSWPLAKKSARIKQPITRRY
jgi:hypothetical protein